jgi:stage II sporulation protein D
LEGDTIQVATQSGSAIRIGDHLFEGPLRIVARSDGITVTETLSPEDYLMGVREVPFAWPDQALRAQAVAARTYLAHTLASGRTATARLHGYDICATTACQVYAGVAGLTSRDGQHWRAAVEDTAGKILLYRGRPAQTLYSSTAGTRTRESEDIFPGLDVPYLEAVDSQGEESPFVRWSFELSAEEMTALLAHSDLLTGELRWIAVDRTADGEGPWVVRVVSEGKTEHVETYRFRTLMNRAAADLMPDRLPARRPDGRRYPQTVLSGTFVIRTFTEFAITPEDGPALSHRYLIQGEGWGHQVGMSQYGALAMAEAGSSYSDILAHYYGGLRPTEGGAWLPDTIVVGLVVGVSEAVLMTDATATVSIDGNELPVSGEAIWRFRSRGGRVTTSIPVGIGTAPRLLSARLSYGAEGHLLRFATTAPARVTVAVADRRGERARAQLGLVEAGRFDLRLAELLGAPLSPVTRWRVTITTESSAGGSVATLVIIPEVR